MYSSQSKSISDVQNSTSTANSQKSQLNLTSIIEDLFLVLTNKEKHVIIKRYSLNNQPKQTLEKIGKEFNVTRERIRQIEKIALNKLRRTIDNTQLKVINEFAKQALNIHGSLLKEELLITEIISNLQETSALDRYIVSLAMHVDTEIKKSDKSNDLYEYCYIGDDKSELINEVLSFCHTFLEKNKDVIKQEELAETIYEDFLSRQKQIDKVLIKSVLEIDKQLKFTKNGIGLISWRHINPKSIRDKAYIVLKDLQKPLHFIEIANRISEIGFDKKVVTTQAVHNELIRCEYFVLVGRGLYALKEWGYKEGTVADVIEMLLKKKSPLTKKQIIKGVLKQRKVKKGTISLNLQKNPKFIRVGRAVYALKKA